MLHPAITVCGAKLAVCRGFHTSRFYANYMCTLHALITSLITDRIGEIHYTRTHDSAASRDQRPIQLNPCATQVVAPVTVRSGHEHAEL
jgi:hypothetical protein